MKNASTIARLDLH